jgi:hypothetical protein
MQQNDRVAFIGYIDDMLKSTSAGKIVWKSVNPTTFVWETIGAKLSFQRVERLIAMPVTQQIGRPPIQQPPRKQISYLFQAYDLAQITPIVNVDSTGEPELNQKFDMLFELIQTGISERSLDFLKSILPK